MQLYYSMRHILGRLQQMPSCDWLSVMFLPVVDYHNVTATCLCNGQSPSCVGLGSLRAQATVRMNVHAFVCSIIVEHEMTLLE